MMPRYRVLPYRQGSRSAAALAETLGGRVLRLRGSTFRPRPDDVIINWGNTDAELYRRANRNAMDLRNATNKLLFFRRMRDTGNAEIIPEFWTTAEEVPDEAFDREGIVVCRTELAGHSGAGIVLASNRGELVRCSLYVRYVKKQEEYRVHVGKRNNEITVIATQRKARREGFENPNWQIRNHHNGFNFVRGGVVAPVPVLDVASTALQCSGLDFGAVDVIWNARQERAYVLEINTAPGLEGQTVADYANFFRV